MQSLGTAADLVNIFEVFLPQLLLYPNPTDPLNSEAAALLMREPQLYANKVKGEQHGSDVAVGLRHGFFFRVRQAEQRGRAEGWQERALTQRMY